MQFWSDSFKDHGLIPGECAFGVTDPGSHVALSSNRNPHFGWSDLPHGTQSLALICHDHDVPSRGDDVNQAGRLIPADLPRVDFYHWVLIDLLPGIPMIIEGEYSDAITPRGKPGPDLANGARQGLNDFTGWFAGDDKMSGNYFGYDGPCPPWNDSIPHHYAFTLYALKVPRLEVHGHFTGPQVRAAMAAHILAEASVTGLYSLNPTVLRSLQTR
jgi:Raf kinase inhibitor-like YbhB/YbcL family protein